MIVIGLVPPILAMGGGRAAQDAVPPAGTVYGWQDEHGGVRYTGQLEGVPIAVRPSAVRILRDPESGLALTLPLEPETLVASSAPAPAATNEPAAATSPSSPATLPPVAAATAPGSWASQLEATEVSSWLRPLDALGLLEGHQLYRARIEQAGQPWERLRLGDFTSLEAAHSALRELQSTYPDAWIDRVEG